MLTTGGQCQVQCLYHGPQQISNPLPPPAPAVSCLHTQITISKSGWYFMSTEVMGG